MSRIPEFILQRDFAELARLPLPWNQLRGKHIFITGGTGFIGRYLIHMFCRLNRQMLLNLSLGLLYRSAAPPFNDPCIRWIRGDLVGEFIPEDFIPDIIIHAASPANQQAIFLDPAGVVNCNILATRYLLENTRKNNATFLFFSSGEVYPKQNKPIEEIEGKILVKNALMFYGNNKLAGESLCESYCQKYQLDCRVVRPFSVYGPGESLTSGRCFTDFLRQAFESNAIQVTGPGTQIRSYCYLSDCTSGLLYVLLKGESTVYNIGNEDNTCSIFELAKHVAAVHGGTDVIGPLSKGATIDSFVPNTSKLRQLGWLPQVDLQTCIKRCIESYQ